MALRLGNTLRGSKYSYRLLEKLGDKTVHNLVYKAEVLPGVQSLLPKNRWAVVKSADPENGIEVKCLVNEYKYHQKPSIDSSRNFRKLHDTINDPIGWTAEKPFCLAFEWMDTTLAEVPFEEKDEKDPVLFANVVKVCLEAFVKLEKEHLVYTDLKPANVFISSVDGLSKVKIGDLGLVRPEGSNQSWAQPEAFRAPEVWTGVSCFHKADVWSVGALVLQRIEPIILGNFDNINKTDIPSMAWCLAKIMALFDPSCTLIPPPPPDVNKELKDYFLLAMALTITTRGKDSNVLVLQIPTFEELADIFVDNGIPKVVVDVIRLLAVPNPTNRPSALQALQSPEYKALQEAAAVYSTTRERKEKEGKEEKEGKGEGTNSLM